MREHQNECLTKELPPAMEMNDIHCPGCGHLKFKHYAQYVELKCRCKTLFRFNVSNGELTGIST